MPIHRPRFDELSTTTEIFETGIKAIDLVEPSSEAARPGLFGGAGVGKTVIIQARSNNLALGHGGRPCSPAWASAPARVPTSTSR